MEKECRRCAKILPESKFEKNRRTCRECRREYKTKHVHCCNYCKKTFKSDKKDRMYCSSECAGLSRVERVSAECSYCGNDLEVIPSVKNNRDYLYCDQNCRTEHLKVLMIGESNPNYNRVKKPCDGCGVEIEVHPYKLESLNHHFCSRSCFIDNIGKFYSGENNPNWNKGLTSEERLALRRYPDYYRWRESVYERDNYTCQCCGSNKSGTLNAHHIENFSQNIEKRTCLDNGITLCKECHSNFHKTYGYYNNNGEQLIKYIINYKDALA